MTELVVDSHVHAGPPRFPSFGEYRRHARKAGIGGTVLVQHLGETNNDYLVSCARSAPSLTAVIGMVDVASPRVAELVASAAAEPVFRGVRLLASTRSPGADPIAVWRALADSRLVASVRGPIRDIIDSDFIEILRELPELIVRVDHMGLFRYGEDVQADFERLLALSRFPGVHLMWGGFHAYSAERYPYRDAHPFLRRSLEAFGATRIMWSGDWARAHAGESLDYYSAEVDLVRRELDFLGTHDRDAILGGTARRMFALAPDNQQGQGENT